jgi:hypothetical protein
MASDISNSRPLPQGRQTGLASELTNARRERAASGRVEESPVRQNSISSEEDTIDVRAQDEPRNHRAEALENADLENTGIDAFSPPSVSEEEVERANLLALQTRQQIQQRPLSSDRESILSYLR